MLQIVKDEKTLIVTEGAFNSIFKKQGWVKKGDSALIATSESIKTVKETKGEFETEKETESAEQQPEDEEAEKESPDEEFTDDDFALKPLTEMSKNELKQYAALKHISLKGCDNRTQVLERLSKANK